MTVLKPHTITATAVVYILYTRLIYALYGSLIAEIIVKNLNRTTRKIRNAFEITNHERVRVRDYDDCTVSVAAVVLFCSCSYPKTTRIRPKNMTNGYNEIYQFTRSS